MNGYKILIDTNIIIGLEDDRPVESVFATFARKCSEHGVKLFVHWAARQDLERDKNPVRRRITLSKLEKFQSLRDHPVPERESLVERFGHLSSENDLCDVVQLVAIDIRAVDFFVTQDAGIRKRAEQAGIAANVMGIGEALDWIRQTFEPSEVPLPNIAQKKAYEVPRTDPIFDSLREGYPDFDKWFERCANEHRNCWVIEVGSELAGIVIRKDETHDEARTRHTGPKILKICTFKMKPEFRGEKFGEHLLKQILWFAQRNGYDLVYLTAYPDQEFLIDLLTRYGFRLTKAQENGEVVLEKEIFKEAFQEPVSDPLELCQERYPRFYDGLGVRKFSIPILPQYHRKLFPEIADLKPLPLFPGEVLPELYMEEGEQDRTPGNTIKKVYICRTTTRSLKPGDVLLFYMSKDSQFVRSQSITTVGVIEKVSRAETLDSLLHLVGKRSVFSGEELEAMLNARSGPMVVIDFLLTGHFLPPVKLKTLVKAGVFRNRPPQSISRISDARYQGLLHHSRISYEP